MSNILRVKFGKETQITSTPLYQYDYGQKVKIFGLDLPAHYEVHFSNYERGDATVIMASSNEFDIPDTYFQNGRDIYIWIYLHAGKSDGETEYQITIPIIKRAKPTDEEPTQEQQNIITQTIATLNYSTTQLQEGVQRVETIEDNVNNIYNLVEYARNKTYQYKEEVNAIANQIKNSTQLGYITIGSTRLTEEQLIKLLQLIED